MTTPMDEEHSVEDLSTEVVHDSTTDGVAGETDLNLPVDKPTTAVDTLGVQNGTTHDSSVEPEAYPAESPGIPPTAAVAAAAAPLELLPRPASVGAPSSAPTEGEEDMEDGTPSRPPSIGDRRSHEEVDYPPGIEQEPQDDRQQPPAKKIRRRKPDPIKPFNDMLYDLLVFRSQEGHCRVPLDVKSALGRWVANLRTQKSNLLKGYHSTDLNDHRLAVLDSIEFVWDLQQFDSDARWKRQFQELVDFKNEHDHCNVPQSTPLGKWVKMQRENYRETQLKQAGQLPSGRSKPRPTLSDFRIEQLESLGFSWKVAAPAVGWEHRFEELLEYRRLHGDCNVPQAWPDNRQLGRWVMKQRCQFTLRQKGDKNQLTDERVGRLDEFGFSWTAPSFRKKKEDERGEYAMGANAVPHPPMPHPAQHMLPPSAHHHVHHPLPPHDFRRWP